MRPLEIAEAPPGESLRSVSGPAALLRSRIPLAWLQLAVLFSVLGVLPFVRAVDPDFWWHLRTGELIFDSGIPSRDPFSWTAGGDAWTAHEWLSEAIIYALQRTLGYAGNVILFDVAGFAALGLAYSLGRRAGAGSKALVLATLVSVAMLAQFVTVRPQVFTWLLFAIFLHMLHRHYEGEAVRLWLLPPMMALWANLHLGFVYGLMLVALWCVALAFDRASGRQRDLRAPALVLGACFAVTLLNPDGYHILVYPLRYLQDSDSLRFIEEWQRPALLSPIMAPLDIGLALVALSLLSKDRPGPFLWIVALVTVVLALQAIRNIPFLALVLPAVAGPAMAGRWAWARAEKDSKTRVSLLKAVPFIAALVVLFASSRVTSGTLSLRSPSEGEFPSGGAAWLDANLGDRRLFNNYRWGGYLIYKLYPGAPVFIDGRSDLYRSDLLLDYIKISRAQKGWQEAFDTYGVEVVIVHRESVLAGALLRDPAWEEAYEGPIERVFERR